LVIVDFEAVKKRGLERGRSWFGLDVQMKPERIEVWDASLALDRVKEAKDDSELATGREATRLAWSHVAHT
jgi:hypothetical protein